MRWLPVASYKIGIQQPCWLRILSISLLLISKHVIHVVGSDGLFVHYLYASLKFPYAVPTLVIS